MLRKLTTRKRDGGFTLIELIVVMTIIAVLALVAVPIFTSDIRAAKEAALKEDLHVMRTAIQAYTEDKNKAPQSLDDLVQAGYLAAIPEDPMTHSRDSWQTDSNDTFSDLDQTEPGITDVHSGSDQVGSDGQAYSTW